MTPQLQTMAPKFKDGDVVVSVSMLASSTSPLLMIAVEWQMGVVGSYRRGVLCFPGGFNRGLLAPLPQDRAE